MFLSCNIRTFQFRKEALFLPPRSGCNPAGFVAVSVSYQRMSSGRWCLRLGLCSAALVSSRLHKRDAHVNSGLHKDKSSPVKLRLFTSDNDKRKLDETRTSRGSDYAPSRSPSHRTCHLSPFSTDTRVKEEKEEKSRCVLTEKKEVHEKVCAWPY